MSRCQRDDENFSLRVSLNKKFNSKEKKSYLQPGTFLSSLNQLVCLLAPWGRVAPPPLSRVLAGRPTDSRDSKIFRAQRDNALSRWQRDDENFSLRVDPPLQFCSKLLYIYYELLGIIWLNESKISRCQRDDENFSLRVYLLS